MSAERQRGLDQAATSEALGRTKALLSVEQAADLAGISRSVAYRWARLGCLPGAVSLGGRWYVRRLVLLAWLAGDDAAGAVPPANELADARHRKAAGHPAAEEGA